MRLEFPKTLLTVDFLFDQKITASFLPQNSILI